VDSLRIANGTDQKRIQISFEKNLENVTYTLVSNIKITLKYEGYVDVVWIPVAQVVH